jgi:hypothetical protein
LFFELLDFGEKFVNGYVKIIGKAGQAVKARYFSAEQFSG